MSGNRSGLALFLFAILLSLTNLTEAGQVQITKGNKVLLFAPDGRLINRLSLSYKPSVLAVSSDQKVFYAFNSNNSKLSIHDSTTGAVVRDVKIEGAALAMEEDSARGVLYVLKQNPDSIGLLDTRTQGWVGSFNLPATPLSFTLNARKNVLYVGYNKPLISVISTLDGRQLSSITDVDAPVKQVAFDETADRLVALHEKHISVYRLSKENFVDYVNLEAEPASIQVDAAGGNLYVHLKDEPDALAIYSLSNLKLEGWKSLRNREFQGRKVDASSYFINPQTGALSFIDTETGASFTFEQTKFTGPQAPTAPPPGYAPSADIAVNQNVSKGLLPSCDFDALGNLLFTWENDDGADGAGDGVFARRFTPAIVPLEDDFIIPAAKAGDQGGVCVSGGLDHVVMIWRDASEKDGDGFGVFARVFDGTVLPMTGTDDILIPQTTAGRQMMPWVDMKSDDTFIAAWSGKWDPAAGKRQTFTRHFDPSGNPLSDEVLANTLAKGNTWAVVVDSSPSGRYAVVWRDDGDNGIRGRAYDASGVPVSANQFEAQRLQGDSATFSPGIAIRDDGSFVVVFKENKAGGIVGEQFDANQVSLGTFVVTSKKTEQCDAPVIGMAADGRFVVVWRDGGYANEEIVARVFNADGTPMGDDFVVPEDPAGDEFEPAIAMDSVGNVVAIWKDRDRNPNIFARYFSIGPPPVPVGVTSIAATSADRGTTADFTITGSGFDASATVDFNDPGIIVNSYGTITATSIDVNLTIQNTAMLGFHDIKVSVGFSHGTGHSLFEVLQSGGYPAPTVLALVPPAGLQNTTMDVLINGLNFANHPQTTVDFGANVVVNEITFVSDSQLSVNISIDGTAAIGLRDVNVSNPGPQTAGCLLCFDVQFNPVLFQDDFEDGNFTGWTPSGGSWAINASNRLEGSTSGKATIVATGFAGGCTVCAIEADIRVGNGDSSSVSLMGWYIDSKNYVELNMNKTKDTWVLKQKVNGEKVVKQKFVDSVDLLANTLYHAKIVFDGTNISVFLHNGVTPVITVPATIAQPGTVAFLVKKTSGTIDNVVVNP